VEVKTLFTFLEQLIRAKESSRPPSLDSKAPAKDNPGYCEIVSSLIGHKNLPPQHYVRQRKCVICYKRDGLMCQFSVIACKGKIPKSNL